MNCNDICVVIPYYTGNIKKEEKISLRQCIKILSSYDKYLLIPESMEESDYKEYLMFCKIKRVPDDWLKSIKSYNEMMVNIDFYKLFLNYSYMLIYQLDAFVFSDKLREICNTNYDYIGAPWIRGERNFENHNNPIIYVGNGGLSLRKIESFINVLEKSSKEDENIPEDIFWSMQISDDFKIPSKEEALEFAFEEQVRKCYQLNGNRYPFGVHAWMKFDLDFLADKIKSYGYDLAEVENYGLDRKTQYINLDYLLINNEIIVNYLESSGIYSKQNINIYGAGELGKECGWLLEKAGYHNIEYYDSDLKKIGKLFCGHEIIDKSLLSYKEKNSYIFIAISNERILNEVKNEYLQKGYKNIVSYNDIRKYLISIK